jgi:SynChlorMet cassette protein ScmC
LIRDVYHLELANGQRWQILPDPESSWLGEGIARVARLRAGPPESCTTVALVKKGPGAGLKECLEKFRSLDLAVQLPEKGWVSNNHRSIEFWSHPDAPCVIGGVFDRYSKLTDVLQIQHTLYPVMAGVIGTGGLPVHSALVERHGKGVLIAARGGTGKSTCCRRIPPPWHALCDDESMVVACADHGYHVHPFPTWSDYIKRGLERTWDVHHHVPLVAIFFLKQAGIDRAVPMERGMATASIFNSCAEAFGKYELRLGRETRNVVRARMLENACSIAKAVPAYSLQATLTGQFWVEIEKAIDGV